MFPTVPRVITRSFPRRLPKELKSRTGTPCSIRKRPAGPSAGIAPAGEMASVVTESPNRASTRARVTACSGGKSRGRPQIAQEDRLTMSVDPERAMDQIHIRRPGEGQRDDQRGRRQVAGAHMRVDPPFEIPIAGQHRRGDEITLADGTNNLTRERSAVPDARRAAVADDVEPQVGQGFG